jgi:predicted ATPase
MIDELQRKISDTASLNSKLILLIGPPRSGKTALLGQLSDRMKAQVLNVGLALGRDLLALPRTRRHLQVSELFKALADTATSQGLLLVDNIELLFDRTLQVGALNLLRSQARVRPVVAVWPGDLRENRLSYAVSGHPEYQDHSPDGAILFRIN